MIFLPRVLADERGTLMPIVLIWLVILASLTAAILATGSSEVTIAENLRQATQAQYLAEAGLQDALNALRTTPALISGATGAFGAVPGLGGPGATLTGIGTYTVQYRAVGTSTVEVRSTATATSGAQRTVRATFSNFFSPANALLTGGDLTISGNVTIQSTGSCGTVHSNGNITLSGSPAVTVYTGSPSSTPGLVTASGTYGTSGHPAVSTSSGGNTPTQPMPTIVPGDFLASAQSTLPASQVFQMKSNGQVLDGGGTLITTLTSGDSYRNFSFSSGSPASWSLSGNTGLDGVYYFEGNVSVSGSPGSTPIPWQTSLIATGNITISGNPKVQALLPDTLMISGGNITISGNPTEGNDGLIGAVGSVSITGNASINGFIIADSTSLTDSLSGNPTITYNSCGSAPSALHGPLTTLTWGR